MKIFLIVCVFVSAITMFTGCTSLGTVTTQPSTPAEKLERAQRSTKLVAGLATKSALIAIKDQNDLKTVALTVYHVSDVILAATDNGTVDLTAFRILAIQEINRTTGLTDQQKLILGQVVDAVGLIAEDAVNNLPADQSADNGGIDQKDIVIGIIRAAAQGVREATVTLANP